MGTKFGAKVDGFRTLEEARVRGSSDQPDAPKQTQHSKVHKQLKCVPLANYTATGKQAQVKLLKKHQVLQKRPALDASTSGKSKLTLTRVPSKRPEPSCLLAQPSSTRNSSQKLKLDVAAAAKPGSSSTRNLSGLQANKATGSLKHSLRAGLEL